MLQFRHDNTNLHLRSYTEHFNMSLEDLYPSYLDYFADSLLWEYFYMKGITPW